MCLGGAFRLTGSSTWVHNVTTAWVMFFMFGSSNALTDYFAFISIIGSLVSHEGILFPCSPSIYNAQP